MPDGRTAAAGKENFRVAWVLGGTVVFCGLSLLSRRVYPVFGLVVLVGLALPLAWGRLSGEWVAMGFTRRSAGRGLLWAVAAGVVSSLVGLAIAGERAIPGNLGRQLLIGVPLWLLLASPFQEFFFRGWMQSNMEALWGKWGGLLLSNACFTLWHYLSPIADLTPLPLTTVAGVASTFAAGLAYGYAFQRSRSILAPWVGHVISGVVFILIGAMDFVQALG